MLHRRRTQNGTAFRKNRLGGFLQTEPELRMGQLPPRYFSCWNEDLWSHESLDTNVFSYVIRNSPELEITQISSSVWMFKPSVVSRAVSGVLLSCKEFFVTEWNEAISVYIQYLYPAWNVYGISEMMKLQRQRIRDGFQVPKRGGLRGNGCGTKGQCDWLLLDLTDQCQCPRSVAAWQLCKMLPIRKINVLRYVYVLRCI